MEEKKIKLNDFFKSRVNRSLLFVAVLIFLYLCLQISSCFHENKTDSTVKKQNSEAVRQIGIAEQSAAKADTAAVARRSEDVVREKTIEPRRRSDIAKSADARSKTARAKQNYEISKNRNFNSSVSDDVLRRSNCAELRQLFPGEQFADCQ